MNGSHWEEDEAVKGSDVIQYDDHLDDEEDDEEDDDLYIIGSFCLFVCLSVTKNDHFAQRNLLEPYGTF